MHAHLHRLLEQRLDQAHAVAQADLAPALPAQHGRGLEQHDAVHLGLGAGLEPGPRAQLHQSPSGRRRPPAATAASSPAMTSASTASNTAANSSALSANWWYIAPRVTPAARTIASVPTAGEAVLGEQRPRGPDQRVARRGRALGLGPACLSYRLYVCLCDHDHTVAARRTAMPTVDLPQGRINYRVAGPATAPQPPVVFVHGLLVNGELWTGVADALAAAGRPLLRPRPAARRAPDRPATPTPTSAPAASRG